MQRRWGNLVSLYTDASVKTPLYDKEQLWRRRNIIIQDQVKSGTPENSVVYVFRDKKKFRIGLQTSEAMVKYPNASRIVTTKSHWCVARLNWRESRPFWRRWLQNFVIIYSDTSRMTTEYWTAIWRSMTSLSSGMQNLNDGKLQGT